MELTQAVVYLMKNCSHSLEFDGYVTEIGMIIILGQYEHHLDQNINYSNSDLDEIIAAAIKFNKEINDVTWKRGSLFEALNGIDDATLLLISDRLEEAFAREPEVLRKIAQVLYKHTS